MAKGSLASDEKHCVANLWRQILSLVTLRHVKDRPIMRWYHRFRAFLLGVSSTEIALQGSSNTPCCSTSTLRNFFFGGGGVISTAHDMPVFGVHVLPLCYFDCVSHE